MIMKEKIRIGLIGAGWAAQKHLEVIQAMDGMEAVAVTSRTRARAEQLAGQFHIRECFDDVATLVQKAKPDALMVLVNEDQIFPVAAQAIPYGLPLFIEKPAGLTPQENLELVRLAEQYSVRTMVGFNRRFYSVFHKGLEIIRQHGPLLGVFVEGHERMWRVREGKRFSAKIMEQWVYANSTHLIDLFRFFGGEPKDIRAIAQSRFGETLGDQFAAIMELESGAIGQYQAHWYSPGGWRVVLFGDRVTVEFKPLEQGRWTDKEFKTRDIQPEKEDTQFKAGFYNQMVAFRDLVRDKKSVWPLSDLQDSYKTMLLAQKFLLDVKIVEFDKSIAAKSS